MHVDDVTDVALMVRGLRTVEEATARWPAITTRLATGPRPGPRQSSPASVAGGRRGDRLAHRSLADAPVADLQRGELEATIAELKRLVGSPACGWVGSPRPRPRKTSSPARP